MLTLTRKVGETIRIGDDIEIVVKEIRKNQVRIGIVAPREVKIYREEVYDNIVAERRASDTDEPEDPPNLPPPPREGASSAARNSASSTARNPTPAGGTRKSAPATKRTSSGGKP